MCSPGFGAVTRAADECGRVAFDGAHREKQDIWHAQDDPCWSHWRHDNELGHASDVSRHWLRLEWWRHSSDVIYPESEAHRGVDTDGASSTRCGQPGANHCRLSAFRSRTCSSLQVALHELAAGGSTARLTICGLALLHDLSVLGIFHAI